MSNLTKEQKIKLKSMEALAQFNSKNYLDGRYTFPQFLEYMNNVILMYKIEILGRKDLDYDNVSKELKLV